MATTATATATVGDMTADDLKSLSLEELEAVYKQGSCPKSMASLSGTPKGWCLAVLNTRDNVVGGILRKFGDAKVFPWHGKSFEAHNANSGKGINRINLTVTNQDWFPFDTRFEDSKVDGGKCIVLDYDKPENPWFIRKIHDELREVGPKLFLGPAMWKTKSGAVTVLYFAIDHNN